MDLMLTDLIFDGLVNGCLEVLEPQGCKGIVDKFYWDLHDGMFSVILTEDYLCGYIVPICDVKYEKLSEKDYVIKVLKDKDSKV